MKGWSTHQVSALKQEQFPTHFYTMPTDTAQDWGQQQRITQQNIIKSEEEEILGETQEKIQELKKEKMRLSSMPSSFNEKRIKEINAEIYSLENPNEPIITNVSDSEEDESEFDKKRRNNPLGGSNTLETIKLLANL